VIDEAALVMLFGREP